MESIINKENFFSQNIDRFLEIFNSLKEDYKLLGIMDNSKVEYFTKIILNNLIFLEKELCEDENEYNSDELLSEEEYYN
jgi:hypothetical protein